MVYILSEEAVSDVLDLDALPSVIKEAVTKQGHGAVEQPARSHFPIGAEFESEQPQGARLTMPAYVHGREYYATKLASVHPDNPEQELQTVNAQVALTDAATGRPVAYVAGTHITNVRAAVGCRLGRSQSHRSRLHSSARVRRRAGKRAISASPPMYELKSGRWITHVRQMAKPIPAAYISWMAMHDESC